MTLQFAIAFPIEATFEKIADFCLAAFNVRVKDASVSDEVRLDFLNQEVGLDHAVAFNHVAPTHAEIAIGAEATKLKMLSVLGGPAKLLPLALANGAKRRTVFVALTVYEVHLAAKDFAT